MKISFALLLILGLSLLAAQADPLHQLRLQVAQNPVNTDARLNLAYQLMLSGNSKEALSHYETLLKQKPGNEQAMSGVLWALQSEKQFHTSSIRADEFLLLASDPAIFHSYKAYALSMMGKHHSARQHYATAEKLAMDESTLQKAKLGLAWEYLWLLNYPDAKAKLKELPPPADLDATSKLKQSRQKISLSAGTDFQGISSGSLKYELSKTVWGFEAEYEELLVDSSHFRKKLGATILWQNQLANLKASVHSMTGKDHRVYPSSHYSLSLQSIHYLGKLQINPVIRGYYGSYQRFGSQQADLAVELRSDAINASYSYSLLYLDDDSIGSDTEKQIHSLSLGTRLYRQCWLTAYLHLGDEAWWTSPYMVIYDDFDANDTAYGISLSAPVKNNLNMLFYSQLGENEDEAVFSSSFTLAYSF